MQFYICSICHCDILTIEMCMTFTLTLEWDMVKCKYANENYVCDIIYVGNRNVCSICHHLQDILYRNVQDLDSDL